MPALISQKPTNHIWAPFSVWFVVLGVMLVTEYAIMRLLPRVLPSHFPRIVESLVDAVLLTVVLAPVLWWTIVRPLRRAAALRERFLADLFSTIEDERRRIAHELHDGVGQSLTLVISGLRSLPDVRQAEDVRRKSQELKQFAERALADVKQLALGLRPSLLDDLGLAPAIERIVAELKRHHPIELVVELEPMQGLRLPEKVETALFRIFQESVNNIVKHSGAKRATVRLMHQPQVILLEISDDGRGIDPVVLSRQAQVGGHLGMTGMRERAAQLGGHLVVTSQPGHGTLVAASIPFKKAAR